MLFKSQVYTQASGSVGGLTYSHNAGGMYTRSRTIPTNPATAAQVAVRNAMSQLVVRWGTTLTAVQRNAWAVYAANTPVVNALGDAVNRSGQQMFLRGNVIRVQEGAPEADDGPTTFDLGGFTAPTFSVSEATQLISVGFEDTDLWANEDDSFAAVSASRPQSPGVNFFKGPYRRAGTIDGDAVTAPTSPQTIAVPFPVVAGQKLFLEFRVSRVDGRLSSPFRGGVTVAA